MFDVEVFKKCHAEHLKKLKLKSQGSWALAGNIYLSHLQDNNGRNNCGVFYYDVTETTIKPGIEESLEKGNLMLRHGSFKKEPGNTHMVFFFVDCGVMIGCINPDPLGAIRLASKVITKSDGSDITWFEKPEKIN